MQYSNDYFEYNPKNKHHNPGRMKYGFDEEKNKINIISPSRTIIEKNNITHDYGHSNTRIIKNLQVLNKKDTVEKGVDCIPKLQDTGSNTIDNVTVEKGVDCIPKLKDTGSNTVDIDTVEKGIDCIPKLQNTGSNTIGIVTVEKGVDCIPKLQDTGSNTIDIVTVEKGVDSDDEYYDAIDELHEKSTPKKKSPKPTNKRKNIPKGIKNMVWRNQYGEDLSGPCLICKSTIQINNFEASHIISHANGGSDKVDNLRPLCFDCNRSMNKKNWSDYVNQYI